MFSRAPVAAAPSSRRETSRPTRQRLRRPQLPRRLVRPSCVSDAANAFDAPGAALCSLAIHAPSRRAQPEVSVASALGAVPGLPVSVFSATSMDNTPYLAGLVPVDSEKIVHPKASHTFQQQ